MKSRFPLILFAGVALVFVFFVPQFFRSPAPDKKARQELVASGENQQFQKFNLTGYDEGGKKSWNIAGDTAKVEPGDTVYLDQNVTLKLQDKTVIHTDRVTWEQAKGTFVTQAPVRVDHENVHVKGRGAFGQPNHGFIRLERDIDMVINDTTTLTCDGPLKIYYQENRLEFYRNVKVKDSRGILQSKRMDVFFNGDEKKITQVIAIGDVLLEQGADKSRSHRAVYTVATGAIRLEGSPEVTLQKKSIGAADGFTRNKIA